MNGYNIALFFHITGIVALFGADAVEFAALYLLYRAINVAQVRQASGMAVTLERVFPVALVLILGSGIYMVLRSWSFTDGWVLVALVSLLLGAAIAPILQGRRFSAIHAMSEVCPDGPVPAEMRLKTLDPGLWGGVMVLAGGLLGIIFLMTTKPGLIEAVIVILVGMALGYLAAGLMRTGERAAVSEQAPAMR
ncbi:MAG: hypothetical protein ACRDFS_13080 [Chloroflexota bacterium]